MGHNLKSSRKAVSATLIISIVIVAVVVAGVGTYFWYISNQPKTTTTQNIITNKTFTVGVIDPKAGLYNTGVAYAVANNYLQRYAPNGNFIPIAGGSGGVIQAIQSGKAQLGIVTTLPAIVAIGKGVPIKIIAALRSPFIDGAFVRPDSGINNVTQLKGKTIAASAPGSLTDIDAKVLAAMMNWTIGKDIQIVYVGSSQSELAPTIAGQTAATIILFESGYPYVIKGVLKFIPLYNESWPGFVLIGDKNYISQNPDVVNAVLNALSKGFADFMANVNNSSINFIVNYYSALNLTFNQAKVIFDSSRWYTHFVIPVNMFNNALSTLQKFGLVPKNITVDMLYTSQFVPVLTNATPDQLYILLSFINAIFRTDHLIVKAW